MLEEHFWFVHWIAVVVKVVSSRTVKCSMNQSLSNGAREPKGWRDGSIPQPLN